VQTDGITGARLKAIENLGYVPVLAFIAGS
jgi:hypothetical protein